jgi:hypothetical protein
LNLYPTTLHAINSLIVKLGKLTKATKVYRGVKGFKLPTTFLTENRHGVKGGVEKAFMSTTLDRSVAMGYASGGKGPGIVFEIQQGMINRGAELQWLSQYKHEVEILFGPLTGIEVQKVRIDGAVRVIEVGLSINLNALTLEQVVAKRHKMIGEMCDNLQIEALQAVSMWVDALQAIGITANTAKLKCQVENTFSKIKNHTPESFNIDLQFLSAINAALAVNASALASLLEDLSLLKDLMEDGDELKKCLSDHKYANITEIMIHCIRHKDNTVKVRIAAIKALGEVSKTYDEASINALGECFVDKNQDVMRSAGQVLCKLDPTTTIVNRHGNAWAARTKAGEVVCWGCAAHGGDSSMVQQQLRGVKSISAARYAFAALKEWVPS